jgi:hypothetical protein
LGRLAPGIRPSSLWKKIPDLSGGQQNLPKPSSGFIFKLLIPKGLSRLHKILGKVEKTTFSP